MSSGTSRSIWELDGGVVLSAEEALQAMMVQASSSCWYGGWILVGIGKEGETGVLVGLILERELSYLNIFLWLEGSLRVTTVNANPSPSVRTGHIDEVCGNSPQNISGMGIGPTGM
jgi:hypothetical protein